MKPWKTLWKAGYLRVAPATTTNILNIFFALMSIFDWNYKRNAFGLATKDVFKTTTKWFYPKFGKAFDVLHETQT